MEEKQEQKSRGQGEKIEQEPQPEEQEISNFFIKKGFLLDKELVNFFRYIEDREIAEAVLDKIFSQSKTRIITKDMLILYLDEVEFLFANLKEDKKEFVEGFFKIHSNIKEDKEKEQKEEEQSQETKKSGFNPSLKILSSNIIPDRKIEVKDFTRHFKNRYNFLKDLLKSRKELQNLISIDKIGNNRDFSIIGLVVNKRVTKNKNMLIEVEDLSGRVTLLVTQSKEEAFEKAKDVILDDVVAFRCSGGADIFFVNNLFFADSFLDEKKNLDQECYVVFISDIHVGSNNFFEKEFSKFIDWLNGKGCTQEQKEKVAKIKFMFIVGDSVDGVGIFPGQESQLEIKSLKDQYAKLASYLSKVPKHISMIMCPGQHDAVRVPEPQPPIDSEFAESLTKIENLYLVANPSYVEIGSNNGKQGLSVLMYHGASMHGWISEIEELRVSNAHHTPAKVVRHLLRHRHLSPTHSSTTYVPDENEDMMVIKQVPDIITTGDLHKSEIDMYNNTLIICNSCWQSITPFEEKVGNKPDYCKVPLLNLKTREIKILDFSEEEK